MRIAIIEPGALPAQTANSIQRMKMASALAGIGSEVGVFAPGVDPQISWEDFARQYGLDARFDIRWLPSLPRLHRYDFALSATKAARRWQADLIYTRLPQAAAWAAQRGLPTIFELHDMPMGFMGPWLLNRFLRAPGARRLVANTNFLATQLKARYRIPNDFLLLAPNGVDLERYTNLPDPEAARNKLGLAPSFTIGYTGHLYAGRGAEFILALAKELPRMQFLLVGGRSDDVERMRTQAQGMPNVTITGFVANAELPRYQAAADVLIMPYAQQVAASSGGNIAAYTNPMKMFEYLACGRAIVSSDLPILHEILNEENAILLPSGDLDAWTQTLIDLQNSPAKRANLAQAAKQTAGQHTWEQRASKLLADL